MEAWHKIYRQLSQDSRLWFGVASFSLASLGIAAFFTPIFPLSVVNLVFFTSLLFLAALYRPNWCFLLIMAVLPFETINMLPEDLGFSLRPYQWVFLALSLALLVRLVSRRTPWPLLRPVQLDIWLALIPLGAFLSGLISGGQGIRLAAIVASFYALYLLGRVFLKTAGDVRIAFTVLFASGLAVILFGILQNIAFEHGSLLRVVMPGRPNATFAEPDWLGLFTAILLIFAFVSLYRALWSKDANNSISLGQVFPRAAVLIPIMVTLILTVSRSAWLASFIATIVWTGVTVISEGRDTLRRLLQSVQVLVIMAVLSLLIVVDVPLTRFDLLNRAQSTATGLQEITVACDHPAELPDEIRTTEELRAFGCRHVNLEEREVLKLAGYSIQTTARPDPNIVIRSEIYAKTWKEVRTHPVFGIGWGNIGAVLGQDENGAAYNASNIWLETLLGGGLIGLIGLAGAFGLIAYRSARVLYLRQSADFTKSSVPLVLSVASAFLVFNLFNAGLLIGFVWLSLAAVPALLPDQRKK